MLVREAFHLSETPDSKVTLPARRSIRMNVGHRFEARMDVTTAGLRVKWWDGSQVVRGQWTHWQSRGSGMLVYLVSI